MTPPVNSVLAGTGVGLLAAALALRLADLSWLVVAVGLVALIAAGTGIATEVRS